ncbi:MAG TPA: ATP-binding protein [Mycobacterium sp.]|nr:ATP-binding protein [Mycobacterium sp.]
MKLHRLVLTNYRGIAHREIVLPDSGITVISGVNEVGKSSMIEAIDLLLEAKDRSTKKEVKQIKPTHADVGAEVEAEISTGPYRFIYRKRFHKRCETALTVLAPHREQLTGDEAHERVLAIVDETVDTELWRAQRVLQSSSTAAVDLSRCDALSRALDVAAGQSAALSGDEPALIERIDDEYARYFTPTGRPTAEWASVCKRLARAEAEVAQCAEAVAEVDECVRRHAELSAELAGLVAQRAAAQQRLTAARAAAAAVAELTAQLTRAELVAAAAEANAAASAAALAERRRLCADIEQRVAAVAGLEAEVVAAGEEEAVAREVDVVAAAAAEQSAAALAAAQARVDTAHAAYNRMSDRDEATRLTARLEKIDAIRGDLERAEQNVAAATVSDAVMHEIEVAKAAVERASSRAELASVRVEITAAADIEVCSPDGRITLAAGETTTVSATAATDIKIPEVLTAQVIPGATAADLAATLDAARQHLRDLLDAAGVADVAAARAEAQRRRDALAERDRLTATLSGLCGDDAVDDMRARLVSLRERDIADDSADLDTSSARAALDAATATHRAAIEHCQKARDVAAAAAAALVEKSTRATVLRGSLAAAKAELETARQRLAEHRAAESDDELDVRTRAESAQCQTATAQVAEIRSRLAEMAVERVEAELCEAEQDADELTRRHDSAVAELRDLATQLRVYGTEGRQGKLDAAEAERAHALSECDQVGRRARAAQLLRSVIRKHRDDTRLRYVEPFRAQVQRLGRIVFGDDFEVEIDSSLRICGRTLAGCTVPYESLSGGAKEQLGIVARLAGAALVAAADGVPVIIDDALGFTDSHRLTKMGAVFGAVGRDAQVLVLTCDSRRYDSVDAAHHIELTA